MKRFIPILIAVFAYNISNAQEAEEPAWGIKFTGFVNTDLIWDSRQTVSAREGHFLLWPAAENPDPNNEDINARANFSILSIRTRLTGSISGPDVLGAKTSAVIEGSFFGHHDSDLNGFRLRHAFAKMNWANTELIAGQTWHPMFIPQCFPLTLNFNTGSPFVPFARNPQVRLTQNMGPVKVSLTALGHTDFTTAAGIQGLRNAGYPELHFHAVYANTPPENGTSFMLGGGAGYKWILPVIASDSGYKSTNGLGSFSADIYTKLRFSKLTIQAQGTYGQNNYDVLMLGSYAATSVDVPTGVKEYTPTSCYAIWGEIYANNATWQPGIFAGFTKNLGAGQDIVAGSVAGTRGNIDFIYRISPRLLYNVGKMRFGLELDYTVAAFGDTGLKGEVENSIAVGNFRSLMSVFYFF